MTEGSCNKTLNRSLQILENVSNFPSGFVALAGEEIQQLGTFKGDIIDLDKELSL